MLNQVIQKQFGILVDEDKAKLLHVVFQVATSTGPTLDQALQKYHLLTCFNEFVQELGNKEHALGWCKDPNCKIINNKQSK